MDEQERSSELRRLAEEKAGVTDGDAGPISPEEAPQILHDLRVHQIELEMQNEELRSAHNELESSRAGYFELFDLAPVGYISVNESGRIVESNLTAAALFQMPRGSLVGRRLSQFIVIEQNDELSEFLAHGHEGDDVLVPREFRLSGARDEPQWVRLDAAKSKTPHGMSLLRVTLSDISRQVAADEVIRRDSELIARNSARISMQSALLRKSGALARIGSWRLELDTGRREWSDEMYRIFDLDLDTSDDDVDIAVNRAIHPDDRERVRQVDLALSADGIQSSLDYRIVTLDGATRWLHAEGERELDENGRLVALTGFVQDITDRKQIELALSESEQRFEALFRQAPLGYQSLDESGHFLEVNPAWLAILGYEYEEVLGKWFGEFLAPEFVEPFRERFPLFKERGKIHSEFEMVRKDGTTCTIAFEGRIGHNPDGSFRQTHCILADISERRLAEEEARRNSERHKAILDTALDGFWLLDPGGRILEVNQAYCAMSGYTQDELLGMSVTNLDAEPAEVAKRIEHTRILGADRLEARHRRKDGSTFDVEISVQVRPEVGGATVAFLRDISERKLAENALRERSEELERSNMELQRFAYVASHDLREPLRMVTSYTQLLKKRYAGQLDSDADDFIGYAVDGAARMEALIQDLLAYSRVGSHGHPFKETDLEPVLEGVLKGLEVAIADDDVTLTHDAMPTVVCDAPQIAQIFQNLIINAIKFHGEDPIRLHLGVKRVGDEYVFSLNDNGLGIAPEYFDRIFIIFQRLQSRDDYEGSGMGLAICKRIVQRHHGRIWVESTPGEGSTFFFSLPA